MPRFHGSPSTEMNKIHLDLVPKNILWNDGRLQFCIHALPDVFATFYNFFFRSWCAMSESFFFLIQHDARWRNCAETVRNAQQQSHATHSMRSIKWAKGIGYRSPRNYMSFIHSNLHSFQFKFDVDFVLISNWLLFIVLCYITNIIIQTNKENPKKNGKKEKYHSNSNVKCNSKTFLLFELWSCNFVSAAFSIQWKCYELRVQCEFSE